MTQEERPKLQQQVNDLVERRLEFTQKLNGYVEDKRTANEFIKTVKKELDTIDGLFKEKMKALNE